MRHFLAAACEAGDVSQLWKAMTRYFDGHGIGDLAIVHFPQQGLPDPAGGWMRQRGWDKWADFYVSAGSIVDDPIRAHAMVSAVPFRWTEVRKLRSLTPGEDNHLKELKRHYRHDGLAIPVFGPGGRNGYVVFAFPEGLTMTSRLMTEFRIVAQFAHQRSCELVARSAHGVPLSPREQEVLAWLARGKSNSVIADIIGVSVNTVDTHVRRIFVKLQVSDRVSAAVIAMGQGLISRE